MGETMNFWQNWKTNSAGVVAMLGAFVDIGTNLAHKTQPNWQLDLSAIVIGAGLLFAKDGSTNSTQQQVNEATLMADQKIVQTINKEKP